MSKIICDVCGTSYPDTVTQCPICGCVRPGDKQSVIRETDGDNEGHGGAKGGRFTKSNVRKRNRANGVEPVKSDDGDNRGLVITAIVLLLAIIAVAIYIVVQLLLPANQGGGSGSPTNPAVQTIPCESITLNVDTITFDEKGATQKITVTTSPSNTTDDVIFTSNNDAVVTVSNDGTVTAVGAGQAVITVKCGDVTKECAVECTFSPFEFILNRKELKLTFVGETWVLYAGDLDVKQIVWTTDDASVATIIDGTVKAVKNGTTTVYGEYNGTKLSCTVTCAFTEGGDTGGNDGGTTPDTGKIWLDNLVGPYDSDCWIPLNYSFGLQLKDGNNNPITDVTWTVSDEAVGMIEVDGATCIVTGVSVGYVTVSAEYKGNTYSIRIEVKE